MFKGERLLFPTDLLRRIHFHKNNKTILILLVVIEPVYYLGVAAKYEGLNGVKRVA